MPDEIGTEATRSDAPGADDSLSGDAADKTDDAPAAVVEEQDATEETALGRAGCPTPRRRPTQRRS